MVISWMNTSNGIIAKKYGANEMYLEFKLKVTEHVCFTVEQCELYMSIF